MAVGPHRRSGCTAPACCSPTATRPPSSRWTPTSESINRLERLYGLFGAGDRVDACERGRARLPQGHPPGASYRFLNTCLKDDPRPVGDSEVDALAESRPARPYPIDTKRLRVFPTDSDLPRDQINTTVDRHFVPMAKVELPDAKDFAAWKARLLGDFRRRSFHHVPDHIPPARTLLRGHATGLWRLATEDGIEVTLCHVGGPSEPKTPRHVILAVSLSETSAATDRGGDGTDVMYVLQPRGIGPSAWTRGIRRTPWNGRTSCSAAPSIQAASGTSPPAGCCVGNSVQRSCSLCCGRGTAGVIGAYAACWSRTSTGSR